MKSLRSVTLLQNICGYLKSFFDDTLYAEVTREVQRVCSFLFVHELWRKMKISDAFNRMKDEHHDLFM